MFPLPKTKKGAGKEPAEEDYGYWGALSDLRKMEDKDVLQHGAELSLWLKGTLDSPVNAALVSRLCELAQSKGA